MVLIWNMVLWNPWNRIDFSKCGFWFSSSFLWTLVDVVANYSAFCSQAISIVIWTSEELITLLMFIWMATKWLSRKECFGGILLMLLIFFIQMGITCLLFLFTLRIILGVFLLKEDKAEIMRSGIKFIILSVKLSIHEKESNMKSNDCWLLRSVSRFFFSFDFVDRKGRGYTIRSRLGLDGSYKVTLL